MLWNIFGPVELSARKQNVSMRARPVADSLEDDARADEYDFLLPLSAGSKRVVALRELDSPLVTQMVARGLLLWGAAETGGADGHLVGGMSDVRVG